MRATTILALGMLLATCGGSSEPTTTTGVPVPATSASPSTTTSTTLAETTTTTTDLAGGVELKRRGGSQPFRRLAAGQLYTYDGPVSVELMFQTDGWEIDFVGDRWIGWVNESSDPPVGGNLTFMPFDTIDGLITEITSHPTVGEFTEPEPASLGGYEGVVFDVQFLPVEAESAEAFGGDCQSPTLVEETGIDGQVGLNRLVPCAWNRVWIVDVDGVTVVQYIGVITLNPDDIALLDDTEDLIDELIGAFVFNP